MAPAAVLARLLRGETITREEAPDFSHHIISRDLSAQRPVALRRSIQNAIVRASKSLKHLRWFEVLGTRGQVEGRKASTYQVTLKVGFTLDDTFDPGA